MKILETIGHVGAKIGSFTRRHPLLMGLALVSVVGELGASKEERDDEFLRIRITTSKEDEA